MSSTTSPSAEASATNYEFTSIYPYSPSQAACLFFFVIFFLSGALHLTSLILLKGYRYSALLTWATALYCTGFIVRYFSTRAPTDIGLYIANIVLLFVAPPVYAAVNYLVLGRTLHYVPYLSPIHPGRVTTTFIGLDTLVEVLTSIGASDIAQYDKPSTVALGQNLIRASLLLQVALYLMFTSLLYTVHQRCIKMGIANSKMRSLSRVQYVSVVLILIRSIYRVADSFMGTTGYTEQHEWCLYVFDATPMLLNSLLFNTFHPALFLPKTNEIFLSQDGRTERKGPGFTDDRNFLLTLFDPFDIIGIATGRDKKQRFWDHEGDFPLITDDDRRPIALFGGSRPLWAYLVDPFNSTGRSDRHDKEAASADA